MGLNSLITMTISFVFFPIQVNLFQPEDYFDAWWMLDEAVNVLTEQIELPTEDDATVQPITIREMNSP